MGNLDDLFPGTKEYHPQHFNSSESPVNGYGYKIGNNKYVLIYVEDRKDSFYAGIHEFVTGLTAKPSSRIKNPRKRQLTRTVWATIAPIGDYNTIADAVHDMAAKLRERYLERYKTMLEAQLEYIITSALQASRAQPPGEA